MRILLVEDETAAAAALARGLREQSFAVDISANGDEAMEAVQINSYDLVILDILLPRMSGFDVCSGIRALGQQIPVLMLTALDAVDSRIRGLDCGADDYLTKPFDFRELCARIRALLRRHPVLREPTIHIEDLVIETGSHEVRRGDRRIEMTSREYALLEYLASNAGRVVGRAEISEHVWDESYDPFSNLIEVYIQRLRQKIDCGRDRNLIQTKRGEGYIMTAGSAMHV